MESAVNRLKSFFSLLAPPRLVSWQSLFLAGVGMWVLSAFVSLTDPDRAFDLYVLRRVGWFFIAGGTVWRQTLDPVKVAGFPIGALAAASVVVNFVFGTQEQEWTQLGFIVLPILTGLLVTLSYFLTTGGRWRIPTRFERLKAIVALGIGLVLACWLKFYFVTQEWMVRYPRLWNARIENSSFMATLEDPRASWGGNLVREVDSLIYRQFEGQSWSDIELLLKEYRDNPKKLENNLKNSADGRDPVRLPLSEDWTVTFTTTGDGDPSYQVSMRVTWDSPLFFDDRDFSVIRVCEISRAPLPLELFKEIDQTGFVACNTSPEFIFEETIAAELQEEEQEPEAEAETETEADTGPEAGAETEEGAQPQPASEAESGS